MASHKYLRRLKPQPIYNFNQLEDAYLAGYHKALNRHEEPLTQHQISFAKVIFRQWHTKQLK